MKETKTRYDSLLDSYQSWLNGFTKLAIVNGMCHPNIQASHHLIVGSLYFPDAGQMMAVVPQCLYRLIYGKPPREQLSVVTNIQINLKTEQKTLFHHPSLPNLRIIIPQRKMTTKQLFDTVHCRFSHRTPVVNRVPFPVRIASRQPLPGNRLISVGIFSRPVTCAGSRWDQCFDFLTPQFIVAPSGVISAVGADGSDFPVGLANKPREGLCIRHVVQGKVSADNLMCTGVYRQVQFTPDAALFLAVFFHLPLTLTEDF